MATDDQREGLRALLWPAEDSKPMGACYAVLDAARHHTIHSRILGSGLEQTCLHESDCAPDIEEVGAHLIPLSPGEALTEWILDSAPGQHWGIFLRTDSDPEPLRVHLRDLLNAELPDGRVVLFRFYDPRVLKVYLPTCSPEERRSFFGPIQMIYAEDKDAIITHRLEGEVAPETRESSAPSAV